MNRATIIRVDGTTTELDHRPTLEEAQEIVGGWIELFPVRGTRTTLVVDEEGMLKGYRNNSKASLIAQWPVVGDVIILEGWRTIG